MYNSDFVNYSILGSISLGCSLLAAFIIAHEVNRRRRAIVSETKRYEDEKAAASVAGGLGLWQFNRPVSTTTSTTTSTGSNFTLGSINVAWDKAQVTKSRDQRLAERRKFRILEPHTLFCADPEQDEYHEWVPIWDEDIYADTLCRDNGQGTHVWRLWVCNNTDCGAQAYVAEEKVEEIIKGWLDKAAPKPGTLPEQTAYMYKPFMTGTNVFYPNTSAGITITGTGS